MNNYSTFDCNTNHWLQKEKFLHDINMNIVRKNDFNGFGNRDIYINAMLFAKISHGIFLPDLKWYYTPCNSESMILFVNMEWMLLTALENIKKTNSEFNKTFIIIARDDTPMPNMKQKKYLDILNKTLKLRNNRLKFYATNIHDKYIDQYKSIPLGIQNTHVLEKLLNTRNFTKTKRIMCCCMDRYINRINASETLNKNGILCDINMKLRLRDYYNELCMSKYVLAPRGRGRDTFRVWEALSCKTIPIMLRSEYNDADFYKYDGLPILWVQTWNQINPHFLDSRSFNFNTSLYNKKIKPFFWKNMVIQY